MPRQKITPCLWFNNNAGESSRFYVSVFKDSKITRIAPRAGRALQADVEFQLAGLEIIALDRGPNFTFNEAISMCVDCQSQDEVDELWEKLSAGGRAIQCGWLKDKLACRGRSSPRSCPE